ncbi:Glycosyltransferase family 15 protein [Mycena venus]|uniref:Glycosyltransferase family 15 protein n=1 Tax=Mycena venus TaxID=2733690 RepID=A0A8H6XCX2_9AGAR|nr:Glycosyltransferase family 15 protein [Mycena venus]
MMAQIRYVFVALAVLISLHYILSFTNETYGNATSFNNPKDQFAGDTGAAGSNSQGSSGTGSNPPSHDTGSKPPPNNAGSKPPPNNGISAPPNNGVSDPPYRPSEPEEYYGQKNTTHLSPVGRKANAAFVMLARNGDLEGAVASVKQMEDRFNKKFNYPYVFLNEEPFSEEFKTRITTITDSQVQFGLIPNDHWVQPKWCAFSVENEIGTNCSITGSMAKTRASANRAEMQKNNVIYGGSLPYRNMCRFNSGFFYRHELLKPFKYYWRVEPDVKFFCDLDYDPFLVMQDQNKKYGFTVSLPEYPATIPTLWNTVKEFINANPGLVSSDNAMGFLSDDGGETYNRCHFWSNFEIADLDLWRGEAYSKFFDFLDEKGGFYYERWGDAPVHSIGAALFARKDQIHFFNDIGYRHEPFQHCPQGEAHKRGKCWCDPQQNFDYEWYSCLNKYDSLFQKS